MRRIGLFGLRPTQCGDLRFGLYRLGLGLHPSGEPRRGQTRRISAFASIGCGCALARAYLTV
jgi:hypothetical protein